ncbi:hypothetical protein [Ruegeria arenilitoris]|uniref:hypothetical protein n=1 Tax=Ruegeria arenilitoris TaxID=1173585 RepID=UPI001480640B|nr:hypothetical protein [Ruegeria arenilitoris]
MGFIIMCLLWVIYPNLFNRTYVLSVMTSGFEAKFTRSLVNNSWQFSDILLCERRENRLKGGADTNGMCAAELFSERQLSHAEVSFEKGATVSVERDVETGALSIVALSDDAAVRVNGVVIPLGSLMIIDQEAWQDAGALAFSGEVTIGQVATTGETRLVSGGSYEILESGWPWEEGAMLVKSGQFFRGDQIQIVTKNTNTPVEVIGFLAPVDDTISLQVTSPMGKNVVDVDRMAGENLLILSSAIDRSKVDPLLQVLTFFVAVVLALATLRDWMRPPN